MATWSIPIIDTRMEDQKGKGFRLKTRYMWVDFPCPAKRTCQSRSGEVLQRGAMKEPGLDGRHRDKTQPKAGEIQQKRADTLNKNLPKPIPEFRSDATLGTMRKATGKVSEVDVAKEAKKIRPSK
jgi:hypothetical protein